MQTQCIFDGFSESVHNEPFLLVVHEPLNALTALIMTVYAIHRYDLHPTYYLTLILVGVSSTLMHTWLPDNDAPFYQISISACDFAGMMAIAVSLLLDDRFIAPIISFSITWYIMVFANNPTLNVVTDIAFTALALYIGLKQLDRYSALAAIAGICQYIDGNVEFIHQHYNLHAWWHIIGFYAFINIIARHK